MRALIASLFFALAGWFLLDPIGGVPPVHSTPDVAASELSTAPMRTPLGDPPTIVVAGIAQRCSDCHAIFESSPVTEGDLQRHGDLVHDHGMNDRCFNCHSREDRDKLVLHDLSRVPFAEVDQLCAQCHGTLYRDWEAGMHGRVEGSWDPSDRRHAQLVCTQCHDPHAPAYSPMVPLPGPNTFRMGERAPFESRHEHDARNPLQRGLAGHPEDDDS